MSEHSGYRGSREYRVLFALFAVLTCFYAVLFLGVLRHYAFGEPGGFPVFYTTGKLARFDLSGLYNQHLQDIFHPLNDGVGYFFHLPYEAFLLIPLTFLPQTIAFAVWSLINLGCLLGAAFVLRRIFPNSQLLVPFAFGPTMSLLLNGQDVGIVVLLIVLAFDRFANSKDMQAGAILALGLFKFPLILPLVAILAFRNRRVVLGFIVAGAPLLILSAIMVGKRGILEYFALTHGTDAKESVAILPNLRGIIGVLFGRQTLLVAALSILLVLLAAFIKADRIRAFAIAAIVTLLVSWHAHVYDALILLIPMAWMSESPKAWMRQTPTVLVVTTGLMLLNSASGYLLAILVSLWLALLLIPKSSEIMVSGENRVHAGIPK